jgi:hypothetical protein
MSRAEAPAPSVTVAVIGICSAAHLRRCLGALDRQEGAPPFDVVVACDPDIADVESVGRDYPRVRLIANVGQRTPLELASVALRASRGDTVVMTEDHCLPGPDWVARLCSAQAPGRAAVGGVVGIGPDASPVDWAFYFVDFFRYAPPAGRGPMPSLTVCNVAYGRNNLAEIAPTWDVFFHETAVNDALRARFGELWLEPLAAVTMTRHVRLWDALRERYAFGRLFGCTRLDFSGAWRRLYYCALAPVLPVLLMFRMARRASAAPELRQNFVRAILPLTLMVLWWSWGEWLGYLTRRRPRVLTAAPEIPFRSAAESASERASGTDA